MTSIADLPAGFTLGDLTDMRKTVWDVQLADYSTLTDRDRTALPKLATWPGLNQAVIDLIALIVSGQQALPLDDDDATILQGVLKVLPTPTIAELTQWRGLHPDRETSPAGRALATLAAHVAEREDEPGGDLLRTALLATIRAAWPELPIAEAPATAARLLEQARRDMHAAAAAAVA
jgi:hypothetical protein